MTWEDAFELSKTVKWKAESCSAKECWCKIVTTEVPIIYDAFGHDEELYIIGAGSIPAEYADYIVELHNNTIK
jgi:hypothetical protein